MNEGEIRQAANMYALVAMMEALKTRREGMLVDNADRTLRQVPLNYSEDSLFQIEEEFNLLADRFVKEI